MFRHLLVFALCISLLSLSPALFAAGKARHFILVVWDGMRPDFVSPELTPTLWSLRTNGVWFAHHHSAYLTSTEVNGAVLATGAFPQRNGIVANREFRPGIDPLNVVDTKTLNVVRRGDELTGGSYLRVRTVAERAQTAGLKTAIAGSKPVAILHDRKMRPHDSRNGVWFTDGALPPPLFAELTNTLGAYPNTDIPNARRDGWTTKALTQVLWRDSVPDYSMLWLSEPDVSQHAGGPGSEEALAGIRSSDARLSELLVALEQRGVREQTDIIVVSDHGFSTISTNANVTAALQAAGLNVRTNHTRPPVKDEIIVVGNGGSALIYVTGRSRAVTRRVVTALQRQPFIGAVFTRKKLPGTFALSEVKLASADAPDIVISVRWTLSESDAATSHMPIISANAVKAGPGMHATLGPLDLHNTAVACGPDFKRGYTSSLPSGNVDIAPTLLHLMGIHDLRNLDGRVLKEAFASETKSSAKTKKSRLNTTCRFPDGEWRQYLEFSEVDGVRYLDAGNSDWIPKK